MVTHVAKYGCSGSWGGLWPERWEKEEDGLMWEKEEGRGG